jgi:hypothetical protein
LTERRKGKEEEWRKVEWKKFRRKKELQRTSTPGERRTEILKVFLSVFNIIVFI